MPDRIRHVLRVISRPQFAAPKDGDKDKPTSDIQVLRTGEFDYHGRRLSITPKVLDEMVRNFKGPDVLPVDYNHGSAYGMDPESAKAAGWIQRLFKQGKDELWCSVAWTDEGKTYIEAGEYRFTSADFQLDAVSTEEPFDKIGAVLHAVALCNQPFVEGMAPVMLAAGIELPPLYRPAPQSPRRFAMNEARIREVLGLSADTAVTEEHRNLALSKLDEQLTASRAETAGIVQAAEGTDAPAVVATLTAKPEQFGNVIALGAGRVILAKAEHDRLTARAAKADELERGDSDTVKLSRTEHASLVDGAAKGKEAAAKLAAKEVDDVISEGIRLRKVLPAERPGLAKIGLRDLPELTALLSARPENMVLPKDGETGSGGAAQGSAEFGAFVKERETVHLAAKKLGPDAYRLAVSDAVAKFGQAAFDRWQYPEAAAA